MSPEDRTSTLSERVEVDASVDGPAPISAPPPSGTGGYAARMTRPLEKSPPSERGEGPSKERASSERDRAPVSADPRAEGDPSPSGRVERVEGRGRHASDPRLAIDVTHVDAKPIPKRSSSKPPGSKGMASRPPASKAPASRPSAFNTTASRPPAPRDATASKPPSPRDAERRGSLGSFSAVEIATGRRPVAGTPGAPVAMANAGPARSKRVSIREDNLGNRVKNVPDAVGATGRVVPKLLKTKAEIAAAPIDHRAGFLLAHVDGVTSVAGLVDICGMPEEEVEQILERLRRLGIVAVR